VVIFHCEVAQEIPDEWVFHTFDDGGHDVTFFWHPLSKPAHADWHKVFREAMTYIRGVLNEP
jgi:hypothetical protein